MYMDIRCPDGVEGGGTDLAFTHEERHPTTMLSMVANLTPWSDYNQSPRNMYQCQASNRPASAEGQPNVIFYSAPDKKSTIEKALFCFQLVNFELSSGCCQEGQYVLVSSMWPVSKS
jgi:DNA-directed RNA polymerase beta subunit